MLSLALNLLALLMVLGMCWVAMVWLTGRFHGHGSDGHGFDEDEILVEAMPVFDFDEATTCAACEGVGATRARGKLAPCPVCLGTGLLS